LRIDEPSLISCVASSEVPLADIHPSKNYLGKRWTESGEESRPFMFRCGVDRQEARLREGLASKRGERKRGACVRQNCGTNPNQPNPPTTNPPPPPPPTPPPPPPPPPHTTPHPTPPPPTPPPHPPPTPLASPSLSLSTFSDFPPPDSFSFAFIHFFFNCTSLEVILSPNELFPLLRSRGHPPPPRQTKPPTLMCFPCCLLPVPLPFIYPSLNRFPKMPTAFFQYFVFSQCVYSQRFRAY